MLGLIMKKILVATFTSLLLASSPLMAEKLSAPLSEPEPQKPNESLVPPSIVPPLVVIVCLILCTGDDTTNTSTSTSTGAM